MAIESCLFRRIELARNELFAAELERAIAVTELCAMLAALDAGDWRQVDERGLRVRRHLINNDRHVAFADCIVATAGMPLEGPRYHAARERETVSP